MNNKYIYIGDNKIAGSLHENYNGKMSNSYFRGLPKIEVVKEPAHSWEINQILEEDVDFFINNHHFEYTTTGATLKTVAIPIKLNTQYSEEKYSKGEKDLVSNVQNSEGSTVSTRPSSSSNSIEQGNKLIAAFMGYKYYEENVLVDDDFPRIVTSIYSKVPIELKEIDEYGERDFKMFPNPDYGKKNPERWNSALEKLSWQTLNFSEYVYDLKYHTSWEWLMPVYLKIVKEELYGDSEEGIIIFNILYERLGDGDGIEEVWNWTVKFIEWYNNQKSNQ